MRIGWSPASNGIHPPPTTYQYDNNSKQQQYSSFLHNMHSNFPTTKQVSKSTIGLTQSNIQRKNLKHHCFFILHSPFSFLARILLSSCCLFRKARPMVCVRERGREGEEAGRCSNVSDKEVVQQQSPLVVARQSEVWYIYINCCSLDTDTAAVPDIMYRSLEDANDHRLVRYTLFTSSVLGRMYSSRTGSMSDWSCVVCVTCVSYVDGRTAFCTNQLTQQQ